MGLAASILLALKPDSAIHSGKPHSKRRPDSQMKGPNDIPTSFLTHQECPRFYTSFLR
jgi:hypothetical protein